MQQGNTKNIIVLVQINWCVHAWDTSGLGKYDYYFIPVEGRFRTIEKSSKFYIPMKLSS